MFDLKNWVTYPLPERVFAATSTLNIEPLTIDCVSLKQVHGDNVVLLDGFPSRTLCGDAMITRKKQLPLLMRHADCQVAVFFDPKKEALGMAHSGWRGSVANIYANTVRAMRLYFGTDPRDLRVSISPSLSPENAEFIHYKEELPSDFWKYQVKENYFDFWTISEDQLIECGVKPENIFIQKECTLGNPQMYHSYRRDKTNKRNVTIAMLSGF